MEDKITLALLIIIFIFIMINVIDSFKDDLDEKKEEKINSICSIVEKINELSFEEKLNLVNETYLLRIENKKNEYSKKFIDDIKNNNNIPPIFHGGCLGCYAPEWNTRAICFDCQYFQYAKKYNRINIDKVYNYKYKTDYSNLYPSKNLATKKTKIKQKDLLHELANKK